MAVNCLTVPRAIVALAGVTAIDCKTPLVTVRVVEPEMLPDTAEMSEEPCAIAAAKPWVGTALLIVATAVVPELQVTDAVMSCVLLSLKVPVALNCSVVPAATDGVAGVTTMETSVAFTVSVAVPLTLPEVAVIVVEPAALALTMPPLEIVATPVLDEVHETELVRSFEPPLPLYVPVAVNCSVAPIRSVRFVAVT